MSDVVLALDMSLIRTGWAVWNGTYQKGVIATETADYKCRFERYKTIVSAVEQVIKRYNVTSVIIEGYSYGSRGNMMLQLAELGGLVRMMIIHKKLPLYEVAVMSYRKIATGHARVIGSEGKDVKKRVIRWVADNMDIVTKDDNEADALMLVYVYVMHTRKILDKAGELYG